MHNLPGMPGNIHSETSAVLGYTCLVAESSYIAPLDGKGATFLGLAPFTLGAKICDQGNKQTRAYLQVVLNDEIESLRSLYLRLGNETYELRRVVGFTNTEITYSEYVGLNKKSEHQFEIPVSLLARMTQERPALLRLDTGHAYREANFGSVCERAHRSESCETIKELLVQARAQNML